tara:strand:+ start:68 stop:274 length:207 start_codon:yes stop_codon:yes gene_type:complete
MDYKKKCRAIIKWSNDDDWAVDNFDNKVVKSIYKTLLKGNILSNKQEIAINNIFEKFEIDDYYISDDD